MKTLLFIGFIFLSVAAFSQNTDQSRGFLEFNTQIIDMEYTPKTIGSTRLFKEYRTGIVKLKNGDSLKKNLQIELNKKEVEIFVKADLVRGISYNLIDTVFIDGYYFTFFNPLISSTYECYQNFEFSKFSIINRIQIKLKSEDYVAALDVGDKDNIWSLNTVLYIAHNNKILKAPKSKSKFFNMFTSDEVKIYIKENHLDIKKIKDLVLILSKYSHLLNF